MCICIEDKTNNKIFLGTSGDLFSFFSFKFSCHDYKPEYIKPDISSHLKLAVVTCRV